MTSRAPGEGDPLAEPRAPRHRGVVFVVFTTILIDFAGFSLLIPVLPLYADRLGANAFEVGLLLTSYALAQLLFLPAWGWFSDRFGRRPVLIASLLGTVVAYALLAVSETLGEIYAARVLAGFFAAAIGTAQAAIMDVTAPEDRARGMGQIGAAIGVAFVIGPALGGLLGAIDPRLPFQVVAAVAAVNTVVAWFWLPETRPAAEASPDWRQLGRALVPAPLRLMAAVHDRRIGIYLFLFFNVLLGFSALESVFPKLLDDRFQANEWQIGLLFAWMGVVLVVTQGFVLGRLTRRYSESSLVAAGLVACGVGLALIGLVPGFSSFFALAALIGVGYGIAFPTFTSLYTQACEARDAGELLGQSQSMATTGRVLGPMWAGLVMDRVSPELTFLIAGGILFGALAVFLGFRRTLVGDDDARLAASTPPPPA